MKKVIGIAAFAVLGMVALSSCKKDYTCECTVGGSTSSTVYEDIKKSDAEDACTSLSTLAALGGGSCSLK